MPRLEELGSALYIGELSIMQRLRNAWDGFVNFAFRDNVLEVAIGLIFASAFTAVTSSFVSDILLPIISLLPFIGKNFDEKFAVLRCGSSESCKYNTLKQAQEDGATVMAYGSFLDKCIRLLAIGLSLYAIGAIYAALTKDKVIKRQIKCRYCRKWISEKAKRCVNCSSWQDGREDKDAVNPPH